MPSSKTEVSKDFAYKSINGLVKRFGEQIKSYKKTEYNETQARQDFINPFFKALGWDVDNSQGNAEAYREVVHEDRIRVGNVLKAPDYSFKLAGGKRLFFVEAKKPSVFVKEEIEPAYQIRSYAWSAKLPVSILTDFEEFAVYDCNIKPRETDKANIARINYLTYNEYQKEFDFLWNTFSKENVLKGSFDSYIQTSFTKKGTTTVDKEFLASLDKWRKELAFNIALRNTKLNEDELNFVVQQTIDRIIFLRIAEDRSLEKYGSLNDCINGDNYYSNLFTWFETADKKYNSGLFDFKKDNLSKKIEIDNKIIKSIIGELYYPLSPYVFTVLNVEILGNAYEQFLGKQIKLTDGHRAIVKEKPEIRKAGGVYYTPEYIVENIVASIIEPLLKNRTPKEVENIKIADISCGSGSFLLGAYQYLLNWHLYYYTHKAKKSESVKVLTAEGSLSTQIKKKILLNNIYGVDLDLQAVEVTKLSLLLKCMEGETQASVNTQLSLFKERILPTLDNNIKSGNSLIDSDFYDGKLDFKEERTIKVFNWEKSFPEVLNRGGFHAIIGNPPYVAVDNISAREKDYFNVKYPSLRKRLDLFGLFIDKAIGLLNNDGHLGIIIPMQFLKNSAFSFLRKSILTNNFLKKVNHVGDKVFDNVSNDTIIIEIAKSRHGKTKSTLIESKTNRSSIIEIKTTTCFQEIFLNNNESTIDFSSSNSRQLISKIENHKFKISQGFNVIQGIVSGLNSAFIYNEANTPTVEKILLKKFLFGSDFQKYFMRASDHKILYLNKHIKIKDYPKTEAVLKPYKKQLDKRREVVKGVIPWFSLQWPRNPETFERPKIVFQKIRNQKLAQRLVGTYDEQGLYVGDGVIYLNYNTMSNEKNNLKFLLALLNSPLYNFYFRERFLDINLKIKYLEETPIIDFNNLSKNKTGLFNEIVSFVDQIISLNKLMSGVNLQSEKVNLQTKIDFCDSKINSAVYKLYDLTNDEIIAIESDGLSDSTIKKPENDIIIRKHRKASSKIDLFTTS